MPNKIYLRYLIFKRVLTLLTRKGKSLRLMYFTHYNLPNDEHRLLIRYKFSNAIYYVINGQKVISNTIIIVKTNQKEGRLNLTVHGLFRKKEYMVLVTQEDVLISKKIDKVRPLNSKFNKVYYGYDSTLSKSGITGNIPEISVA